MPIFQLFSPILLDYYSCIIGITKMLSFFLRLNQNILAFGRTPRKKKNTKSPISRFAQKPTSTHPSRFDQILNLVFQKLFPVFQLTFGDHRFRNRHYLPN